MFYNVLGLSFVGLIQNFEKKTHKNSKQKKQILTRKKYLDKFTLTRAGDLHVAAGSH